MDTPDLPDRLAALEKQVAEISRRLAEPSERSAAGGELVLEEQFWALRELGARLPEGPGAVLYTGIVDLPTGEHYEWQYGTAVEELLGSDWSELVGAIGALAHPVRLLLLRRILAGRRSAAELSAEEGLGTTGQIYHHLRQLVSAGWLRSSAGHYTVPGERVVPLFVILSGARR